MATLADATAEADRIMRACIGVTAFPTYSTAFATWVVTIHDVRPGSRKTQDQVSLVEGDKFRAWSDKDNGDITVTAAIYLVP